MRVFSLLVCVVSALVVACASHRPPPAASSPDTTRREVVRVHHIDYAWPRGPALDAIPLPRSVGGPRGAYMSAIGPRIRRCDYGPEDIRMAVRFGSSGGILAASVAPPHEPGVVRCIFDALASSKMPPDPRPAYLLYFSWRGAY